jgi:hypothetical protein
MIFKEIGELRGAMNTWNLRERNLGRIRRRPSRGLRGNVTCRGANQENSKKKTPDEGAHLGCLYISLTVWYRKYKMPQRLPF